MTKFDGQPYLVAHPIKAILYSEKLLFKWIDNSLDLFVASATDKITFEKANLARMLSNKIIS